MFNWGSILCFINFLFDQLFIFRTCDKPNGDYEKWKNSSLANHFPPDVDLKLHLDQAHRFELKCSGNTVRRYLDPKNKCSDDFEISMHNESTLTLKLKSTGEDLVEDKFCLSIKDNQIIAQICREKGIRSQTS